MDEYPALVPNSRVTSPFLQARPDSSSENRAAGLMVDVVVLSADLPLYEAIRASVGERNPVWRARSAEESVDLLLTGRCGVMVMDMALVSARPSTLVEQIVEQFPDVVVVVAGRREDEALLAQLISDGLVYRFMHKPLTARRAGMFLNAAIKNHVERRGLRAVEPLLPLVAKLPSRLDRRKWLFVAVGIALFLLTLALLPGGPVDEPTASRPAIPPPSSTTAPGDSGLPLADPVLSRARAAFAAGRYETPPGRNALDLYAAVLLARPNHPEARVGLDRTLERVLAMAEQAHRAGRSAEAQRLLQHVRAADPGNPAVERVAARLEPAPPPAPAKPTTASTPARAAARPSPPPKATVATPPPAPPSPTTTPALRAPSVMPDPLTPRVTNAEALRTAREDLARRREPLSFGPPISSGHAIAGYVRDPNAGAFLEPSSAATSGPGSPALLPTAADDLDRLIAPDPAYPPAALRDGVEGWVELAFTITETGIVRDIEVVAAEPRGIFEKAAMEALGQWRFRPRSVNGQSVARRSVVTLRFSVER
jgi:protein TonB